MKIEERISSYLSTKIKHFLSETLKDVENITKKYNIDDKFFIEKDGYYCIRKNILDKGNDLIRLLEIIISELEIVPKKAIIDLEKVKENGINKI